MKQVVIDRTDVVVSRLAFGTASLHHLTLRSQRQRLLHLAASVGITHFDSAPCYGYGLAERELGRFLRGQREKFTIATKIGLYSWGWSVSSSSGVLMRKALGSLGMKRVAVPISDWQVSRAQESLRASLERLGSDYVDFLLLHEPDRRVVNSDELLGWLEAEYTRGSIRAWGVAGEAENIAPFVVADSGLARVVQTRDSVGRRQADFMTHCRRELQFTYGYLSSQSTEHRESGVRILRQALARNRSGSIVVSTRKTERMRDLARIAGER